MGTQGNIADIASSDLQGMFFHEEEKTTPNNKEIHSLQIREGPESEGGGDWVDPELRASNQRHTVRGVDGEGDKELQGPPVSGNGSRELK